MIYYITTKIEGITYYYYSDKKYNNFIDSLGIHLKTWRTLPSAKRQFNRLNLNTNMDYIRLMGVNANGGSLDKDFIILEKKH